jgi:hypothetical protein
MAVCSPFGESRDDDDRVVGGQRGEVRVVTNSPSRSSAFAARVSSIGSTK